MRLRNRSVIDRLVARFETSSAELRRLRLDNAIPGNTLAGLPVDRRYLLFPNQAELYLFADPPRHFVRDVIDVYTEMTWQLDSSEPARAMRLIPAVLDMTVDLESLEVTLVDAPIDDIDVFCSTLGHLKDDGFYLTKASPYFDVNFLPPVAIQSAKVTWAFRQLGSRVGESAARSTPPVFDLVLRNKGRETKRHCTIPVTVCS